MRHRGYLPPQERQVRSRLAQIVHQKEFINGSLVTSSRKCGKINCWCAKEGEGHISTYLSVRVGNKRKMIYVPKFYEQKVRERIQAYKEMSKGIAKVCRCCLDRLREEE